MASVDKSGMRVLVVGASKEPRAVQSLIDAGAEVHSIDKQRPIVSWLGSHTDCDIADAGALRKAVDRVGSVLHALYIAADMLEQPRQAVIDAARAKSIDGIFEVSRLDDSQDGK